MRASLSLCLILAATTVQAHLPTINTTAAHVDDIICVYQISGQYGFLPRLLYYSTLVFAVVGRYQEWLVIGALASALTYSGVSAIHMLCLTHSRRPIYDLDILACWAILSTGCLGFVAMIHWSSTVKQSRAKVVLILWGILMGIGLVTGRSLIMDINSIQEPACRSSSGRLLEYPYQRLSPAWNCTYNCFKVQEIMRQSNEQMAISSRQLNTKYAAYGILLVGPIMAAAYKSMSLDFHAHSPSEMCRHWVMHRLLKNSNRHQSLTDHVYDAAATSWYGGYIILVQYMHRQPWSRLHIVHGLFVYPWLVIEFLLDVLTPPMFITNIILNELNIQGQNLPTNEQPYAIGQWSPLVSTLLVIIASAVVKGLEIWDNRRKTDIPREEGPAQPDLGSDTLPDPRAMEEGQISGIIVRKLQHAETLRDMENMMNSSTKHWRSGSTDCC